MMFRPWSHLSAPTLLAAFVGQSSAFVPHMLSIQPPAKIGTKIGTAHVVLSSTADDAPASGSEDETTKTKKNKATLGFITFDLDDTLYPVGPVFTEANEA